MARKPSEARSPRLLAMQSLTKFDLPEQSDFSQSIRLSAAVALAQRGAAPIWPTPRSTNYLVDPPSILEMQTYRCRGHSMSDPAKYRTREEVEKIRHDQDPIEHVRTRLLAAKVSEEEFKAIDGEVRKIVNAAADFAQQDPEPDPSELYTDVYR